jgi:DNA polymerase I-like protein with 3'-5' exonuclease and polymerase domains
MARYDGGAYAETVVNGKKEDQSDVHNVNKRAVGLNKRDSAKRWVYALIYGAGDFKLGTIVYDDFSEQQRRAFLDEHRTKSKREGVLKRLGEASRARIMKNLPALAKLVEAVKAAMKTRGHLVGLDGRLLHCRAEHSALNTLLQSAGAVAMKKALVLLNDSLIPYRSTNTAAFCANVHDEWQIETEEAIADDIGRTAAEAIRRAGVHYNFRCPLAGSYKVGPTWASTH